MRKLAAFRAVHQIECGRAAAALGSQVSDSMYGFEGQRTSAREVIRCPTLYCGCCDTDRRRQGQDPGKAGCAQGNGVVNA